MINATGNRMTAEIRRQTNLADNISRLQQQISSGVRIDRPSDDPVAAARISGFRQQQSDMATWLANLDIGITATSQADGVLKNASDLVARYQQLTVAGASGSASAADRATMASELRSIADELDSLQGASDASGNALFPLGTSMQLRIDAGTTVPMMRERATLFEVGGVNVSDMVRNAASAMNSGNAAAIEATVSQARTAVGKIADSAALIGLDAARLDRVRDSHMARQIDIQTERKAFESTDLTQAIAELNATQVTLEAAQAAFARINRKTLFDILG